MRPHRIATALLAVITCIAATVSAAAAQTKSSFIINASEPVPTPETGFLRIGTNVSPTGHTIDVTSRFLTRDGKPWLPVMGEFHFSRYPEEDWEEELLKMKAGGVQIVASYVIWIHHEEEEGRFDWSGQRNLRRFIALAGKHGLYAFPRIGPWSHAEVRNGGFPDWLMRATPNGLRSNDSTYLAHVGRYYREIARQLDGLLWKQGGPIIGTQLENEYNQRGPARGEEHILALKQLAVQAGIDVPLYTVTGWDNAVLPPAEVIPVFGGYPDMPWDASTAELPPGEVYTFRFENRWAGNMGAVTKAQQIDPTAQAALARYPFLGAEYGGGIQITYHRRPVISPNDVAAMLPVQIGSGVNLYGYYMFHGGTNPSGKLSTLHESQRTGYPTDVPVKSYDFQTLLSEFGEMRDSFRKTKLMHYFLNEFGDLLAPMVPHRPDRVPASSADTTMLRVSARTLDNRGYIFFNNYVRNYSMPRRPDVQLTLRLPGETLHVPTTPIAVPAGSYFVWPVNLDMRGVTLKYSTAQLLTRIDAAESPVYFFFAIPGIAPEFLFDAMNVAGLDAPGGRVTRSDDRIYVRSLPVGTGAAITLRSTAGTMTRIVLLTQQQAEDSWRVNFAGAERLILSPQDVFSDGVKLHLRGRGEPNFELAVFPAFGRVPAATAQLHILGADGIFARYKAALPQRPVTVTAKKTRVAEIAGPVKKFNAVTWRKVEIALVPGDSAFDGAARYRISVPADALTGLADLFLEIRYVGDVARLYSGNELLDDNFFNGTPWRVGLSRFAAALRRGPLELRILPLRSDAPIYIPAAYRPTSFPKNRQRAELLGLKADPVFELLIHAR